MIKNSKEILLNNRAEEVRAFGGRNISSGISNIGVFEGLNTHVFQTDSLWAIGKSVTLNKWTTGPVPAGIKPGDRIIVIPTLEITERYGKKGMICLEFIAADSADKKLV